MGDLYFTIPGWPFVDTHSGGSVKSLLLTLDTVLAMIDDDTKVIPGHGGMSDKAELLAYRNMIGEAVARVLALKNSGSTLEEAQAAEPLAGFDRGEGLIGADDFIEFIWISFE